MLFNSYEFILVFLPLCLLVYFQIVHRSSELAIAWIVVCSLVFYGWWNSAYLLLLILSILFNYYVGAQLTKKPSRVLLILGITANLGAIAYYKYTNFLVDNLNYLFSSNWNVETIVLPLAISFFTFQQITYLVDSYRGEVAESSFLHYALFVTFFPQLIAGPIVHHSEIMPQFVNRDLSQRKVYDNVSVGISIFIIGLAKKVLIADRLAPYATEAFDAAAHGASLSLIEAWRGAMAYTFQLYFDFSGYSDMAIGIAYCFGIVLPINFNSPYKARNIIDFWRRWHMTLSRFLKDYVYIPLGGNRHGKWYRYRNLMLTMILGGLWHGAAWTFIFWGLLHGVYLVVNHGWHRTKKYLGWERESYSIFSSMMSRLLTLLAIVIAWVFFRADSMQTAISMLKGMFGVYGVILPESMRESLGPLASVFENVGGQFSYLDYANGPQDFIPMGILILFVWYLPNTLEIVLGMRADYGQTEAKPKWKPRWKPNLTWLVVMSMLFYVTILNLSRVSEFLYFQF